MSDNVNPLNVAPPKLSIVVPTWNRADLLHDFMQSCEYQDLADIDYEWVIVDGGSIDHTAEVVEGFDHVYTFFKQESDTLIGAVNEACRRCRGKYVFIANDDALVEDRCLVDAARILDVIPEAGQVAIPFWGPHRYPKVDYMDLRGTRRFYANFGMTRRILGDQVNWWGTSQKHYGGDVELSYKVQNLGRAMFVMPGNMYCIHHLETVDGTRRPNNDWMSFQAKWIEWQGPGDTREEFCR